MKNKIILLSVMLFGATTIMSAQTGIGTAQPHQSAQLDITSSDKGVLIPRIALTSATQQLQTTVANEASLLIYNTATVAPEGLTPGYYYWDAAKWNRIVKDDEIPAPVNITADNGLTKTANNIALGGSLTGATTVTTTAANTLAVAGLQQTSTIATDKVVVMDANGVLKIADASDFAKTRNTTIYSAENDGAWSLLGLTINGANWSRVNLGAADTKLGDSSLFTSGIYTVPETGIYTISYEVQLEGGVDLGLLGGKNIGIIKNNNLLEIKKIDAVRVSLLGITLASVPVTSTSINTLQSLTAGDQISFGAQGAVLDLGLLTDGKVSIYIYKISDL